MDQPTFADLEYRGKKRKTRRELFLELFLERMDGLIPWQKLEERIRPVYPKPGKGRRAYPLLAMLRIHCVQLFYNLSDPGMEDLLYEGPALRGTCSTRDLLYEGPALRGTCSTRPNRSGVLWV